MNRIARIGGRFIYRGFRTVPDSEVRFYAPWNKALAGSWNESSAVVEGNKEEKRGEREGSYFALWTWTRAWFEVSPSRGAFEHASGIEKKGREKKKKFLRLCTLFTQIYDRRLRHR